MGFRVRERPRRLGCGRQGVVGDGYRNGGRAADAYLAKSGDIESEGISGDDAWGIGLMPVA
jgi:hypothetical protein